MKIEVSKLREFFRRTGQVKEVSWDENIFIEKPKVKTIQPDKRLSFNETFKHIHNELDR
jgi:hypothetical protein